MFNLSIKNIQALLVYFAAMLVVTACVSGSTDAPKAVTATVTVALTDLASGSSVTSIVMGKAAKVTATVRDTAGVAVPNTIVTFTTTPTLVSMIPQTGTALTDSAGVATIQIEAANFAASGATTVTATATLGATPVSGSVGFSVVSSSVGPTGISIALTNPTTLAPVANISASDAALVTAIVRDGAGLVKANTVVTFSTSAALATMVPASGSALTNDKGEASIRIIGASPTAAGAATISATAVVGGATITANAGFGVLATNTGATGISIALVDPADDRKPVTSIKTGSPAKVIVTLRDTNGALVPNAVVTFTTSAALASMVPSTGTALTGNGTGGTNGTQNGVATILINAASSTAAGAATITATASVGGASLSASAGFSVIPTSTGVTGNVKISSTTISPNSSFNSITSTELTKVYAYVVNGTGSAVPNTTVTFTAPGALITMFPSSGTAVTDSSGMATIQMRAASPTAAGTATVTANAIVDGTPIAGTVTVDVVATQSAATVVARLTDPAEKTIPLTSISWGKPARVIAKVTNGSNKPVDKAVVTFVTSDINLSTMIPANGTALTDSNGEAFIYIDVASAASAGAITVTASATVDGGTVSGSASLSVTPIIPGLPGISVKLTDPDTAQIVTNVSSGKAVRATATLRYGNVMPIVKTVVTFTSVSPLITLTPSTGTALTSDTGEATILIDAASTSAAGAITVTARAVVDGVPVSGSASLTVSPINSGGPSVSVVLTDTDPKVGAAVSSISWGSPAKVKATVKNASGFPAPNTVVAFGTDSLLAIMTPSTGTALTDAGGVATIQIEAASLTAAGATNVQARAVVDGLGVLGSAGFSVTAAKATLGAPSVAVGVLSLSPYATTSVSIPVTGVPDSSPVTVNLSSICAGAGKATLPASVQTAKGVATATYTDKGCAGPDTVTFSIAGLAGTKTISFNVDSPGAASIQFVSASPATIVLKGTGGAGLVESSLVKFRVVDRNNLPVTPAATVKFTLNPATADVVLDGVKMTDLPGNPVKKQTDSNGEVSVTVQSGTIPTAVSVIANVLDASGNATTLLTQSNQLRVSTGRPAQDRFSLSVSTHNIEGYTIDGITTTAGVIASDRMGNPVPDGTAINFISEGGQITPSCATVNGACSVTFTSANPRPTGDSEPAGIVTKGRVTIVAYTLGEESFVDANGNNKYDSGETFNNLGEVFINNDESVDVNGNPTWKAGEQSVSFNPANTSSCTNGITTSPAAPSKADTCDKGWGTAHVRQSTVIVMSGSNGFVKKDRPDAAFVPGANGNGPVTCPMGGAAACTATCTFYAFDQNKNPLPFDTQLASPSTPKALGTVTFSPAKVQDSTTVGGTMHQLLISKPIDATTNTCLTLGTGGVALSITLTTPKGTVSTADFTITD